MDDRSRKALSIANKNVKVDIKSKESEGILHNLVEQMNKSSTYFLRPNKTSLILQPGDGDETPRRTIVRTDERVISSLNSSIKLKYYLQWFLVFFIHLSVFWYLPSKSNNASQGNFYCNTQDQAKVKCNEVSDNMFLISFYLLYCLYFYYSAEQIRYGYPELKKSNFLMKNTTPLNKLAFQIFRAIPFLLELKIFTDWSFTRTGLDVFQWIKFENIYGDLFVAKCINKGYVRHKIGDQIPKWMKFLVGICGTFGLVIVIAGPMLLFSTLNPIAEDNFVVGTTLDLSIEVNVTRETDITNKYNLFHNDHVVILRGIQNEIYNQLNLSSNIETKNIRRTQMQEIMMSATSDTTWDIAPPSQDALFAEILSARNGSHQPINLRLTYSFNRANPPGNQVVSHSIALDVTQLRENATIIEELYKATNPNNSCANETRAKFIIEKMYYPVINLYENGDPEVIALDNQTTSVTITESCRMTDGTSRHYWEITQDRWIIDSANKQENTNGLIFVAINEKITPSYLGNYSIIGFYTIIVYAIGTLIRRGK